MLLSNVNGSVRVIDGMDVDSKVESLGLVVPEGAKSPHRYFVS